MIYVIRLNGKQVKYLCCPRNGKQVWMHQYATVSNHGKAMHFVLRARISALSAGIPQGFHGSGNAAGGAWTAEWLHTPTTLPSCCLLHFL